MKRDEIIYAVEALAKDGFNDFIVIGINQEKIINSFTQIPKDDVAVILMSMLQNIMNGTVGLKEVNLIDRVKEDDTPIMEI